ncbi:MAG: LemA family protein [Candidatus Omnitrophica bacterium]|nr:LemA family protein [Candidatus Omnitrophota bacterium]
MGVIILGLILFLVVGAIMYFVAIYNGLIRLKHNVDKAWSNIGVLLKQRHDEIPKLIKVCEGHMKYERETLQRVTEARTACMGATTVGQAAQSENMLAGALKSLFAVAENYPDLKANQSFLQLQGRVTSLENNIADRREFYNESVNNYNIRIQQLPDVFVANMMNMSAKELFQITEEDKKDVDINFNMT